jgi:hypothetical protein
MQAFASRLCAGTVLGISSLFVLQATSTLHAAPIVPGGVQFPAIAEPGPVGGTQLATTGPVAFSSATFNGFLTSSVFTGDTSNPFGLNGLTFVYQLVNAPNSGDSIGRLTVSSFDNFLTDVSYNPTLPVGGTPPTLITRSANGQVMGFDFVSPALAPNTAGANLVVQTNSTQFNPTFASVIDGSTAQVASFAPLPVPEPSAVAALALSALAIVRRRR